MHFQRIVPSSRLTLPAAQFLSLALWLAAFMLCPLPCTQGWLSGTELPWWAGRLASFALCTATAYFLIQLNNRFALIRTRASLETAIGLLLAAACPAVHLCPAGDVSAAAFLLAVYCLFGGYHRHHSSGYLFRSFAFLGAGSLAVPQLTFLTPLFWAGAYGLRALNLRSFLASLIGWFFPYWFLLGHAYFYGDMELFLAPFRELSRFSASDFTFRTDEAVTLGFLFALFALSGVHHLLTAFNDKISTRSYLYFLILAGLALFAAILFQPPLFSRLLPSLIIPTAILAGRLLVSSDSRLSDIFFILTFAGLFLLFGFNLWMLL